MNDLIISLIHFCRVARRFILVFVLWFIYVIVGQMYFYNCNADDLFNGYRTLGRGTLGRGTLGRRRKTRVDSRSGDLHRVDSRSGDLHRVDSRSGALLACYAD